VAAAVATAVTVAVRVVAVSVAARLVGGADSVVVHLVGVRARASTVAEVKTGMVGCLLFVRVRKERWVCADGRLGCTIQERTSGSIDRSVVGLGLRLLKSKSKFKNQNPKSKADKTRSVFRCVRPICQWFQLGLSL